MRHVFRHLLTIISALSLLLCVAVCVMWVWSYWNILSIRRTEVTTPDRSRKDWNSRKIAVGWGQLSFERIVTHADPGENMLGRTKPTGTDGWTLRRVVIRPDWEKPKVGIGTFWNRLGFGRLEGNGIISVNGVSPPGYSQVMTRHEIPLWVVVLVTAMIPARAIMGRWLAMHRRRHGQCLICGYDLRASVERCPECGAAKNNANLLTSATASAASTRA
jgi:hypothetical protein